jgi:hypothetical protein
MPTSRPPISSFGLNLFVAALADQLRILRGIKVDRHESIQHRTTRRQIPGAFRALPCLLLPFFSLQLVPIGWLSSLVVHQFFGHLAIERKSQFAIAFTKFIKTLANEFKQIVRERELF